MQQPQQFFMRPQMTPQQQQQMFMNFARQGGMRPQHPQQHQPPQKLTGAQMAYQEFMRMQMMEDWYLDGAHKNRILLALQSSLPNEVDWAFNKLVLLSFLAPDNFVLTMIPGIVEAILDHAEPYFLHMSKVIPRSDPNAIIPTDDQTMLAEVFSLSDEFKEEDLERSLQIFHIFRNFSFLDANVPVIVSNMRLLKLVSCGMRSIGFPKAHEIRLYALDVLENLAVQVRLRDPKDPLLLELKSMVFDNDRAIILGSLRTLSKLVVLEPNEPVFAEVDSTLIKRLLQLLYVWDEELVAAVMDFLYQYTCLYGQVPKKIAQNASSNIVHSLLKFLEWRQPRSTSKPANHLSSLDPVKESIDFCIEWWKKHFESDMDSSVPKLLVYGVYTKSCASQKIQALPFPEFFQKCSSIYTESSTAIIDKTMHTKGIKIKQEYVDMFPLLGKDEAKEENKDEGKEDEKMDTEEDVDVEKDEGTTKDSEAMDTDEEDEEEEEDESDEEYDEDEASSDSEKKKTRRSNRKSTGSTTSQSTAQVSQTAPAPSQPSQPRSAPLQQSMNRPSAPQASQSSSSSDESSIPLTAALVLRNLAQAKENHSMFLPYEMDFVKFSLSKHLHESVLKVLANILFELSKVE